MDSIHKTLYIPLYAKAYVSRRGILLHDPKAEEIWAAEGFALKGKSKSKWLAFYMGMRSAVFDRWVQDRMEEDSDCVVLHLGCGMDSRCSRVGHNGHRWFDVDFPEVIAQRKRYYLEDGNYKMIGADVTSTHWLAEIPGERAIVVMEGISMYLPPEKLRLLLAELQKRFQEVHFLMDCYSEFAAKASRFKNPINDVGVTTVYGLDDPKLLEDTGLRFVREHTITPEELILNLQGMEQTIFRTLYAGSFAKKLYRLYEFQSRRMSP